MNLLRMLLFSLLTVSAAEIFAAIGQDIDPEAVAERLIVARSARYILDILGRNVPSELSCTPDELCIANIVQRSFITEPEREDFMKLLNSLSESRQYLSLAGKPLHLFLREKLLEEEKEIKSMERILNGYKRVKRYKRNGDGFNILYEVWEKAD